LPKHIKYVYDFLEDRCLELWYFISSFISSLLFFCTNSLYY